MTNFTSVNSPFSAGEFAKIIAKDLAVLDISVSIKGKDYYNPNGEDNGGPEYDLIWFETREEVCITIGDKKWSQIKDQYKDLVKSLPIYPIEGHSFGDKIYQHISELNSTPWKVGENELPF